MTGSFRRQALQAAAVVLTAAGLFAGGAHLTQRAELAAAERDLLDTDRVVAVQVESQIDAILAVLGAAADGIGRRLAVDPAFGTEKAREHIQAMKAGLPLVDTILAADASGVGRVASSPIPEGALDLSDREYFVALRDGGPGGVAVSPPLQNRLTGQTIFVVARRVDVGDRFGGIVAAAIRPEQIGAFFGRVRTVPDAKLSVVRRDGTMLFRVPTGHLGSKVVTHWTRERSDFGVTRFVSVIDGVERIAAYRVLPNAPMVVVVSRDLADVLEPWRTRTALAGAVCALLLCVVVPLWLYADHQARRRRAAAEALREGEERLRAILAASPFLILVSALDDGFMLLHNHRAEALFGVAGCAVGLFESGLWEDSGERDSLRARLLAIGAVHDAEVRLRSTAAGAASRWSP